MSKRCSSIATTTNRICQKKFSFIIKDKKCCHIHAKILFNKYALTIQKIWKGYKARNLMTKIYTRLPDELQRKIIFNARENHLIKKHHHNIIHNILKTKLNVNYFYLQIQTIKIRLQNEYTDIDHITDTLYSSAENLILINCINKIIITYSLYTKYCSIAPEDIIVYLKRYCDRIIHKYYFENYSETLIKFKKLYECIKKFEQAAENRLNIKANFDNSILYINQWH